MEYLIKDKKFDWDYEDLKGWYDMFANMTDKAFLENIKEALHCAIYISFIKDIPSYICLSDMGIIHELSHLVCGVEPVQDLTTIRNMFKEQLKLS